MDTDYTSCPCPCPPNSVLNSYEWFLPYKSLIEPGSIGPVNGSGLKCWRLAVKPEKGMKRQIFFSSLIFFFEIKKTSESDLLFEPFFPALKIFKFYPILDIQHFEHFKSHVIIPNIDEIISNQTRNSKLYFINHHNRNSPAWMANCTLLLFWKP